MKQIKYLIIAIVFFMPQIVKASLNVKLNVDQKTVNINQNVKAIVTLNEMASWNIKITGNDVTSCTKSGTDSTEVTCKTENGKIICSKREVDVTSNAKNISKTFELSCQKKEPGTITFTVTGDITNEEGETKDINESIQVLVTKNSDTETIDDIPKTSLNTSIIIIIIIIMFVLIGIALITYSKNSLKNKDNN